MACPFLSNVVLKNPEGDFNANLMSSFILPITTAAFVFRVLNCKGLQIALYRSYAMKVKVNTLTDTERFWKRRKRIK